MGSKQSPQKTPSTQKVVATEKQTQNKPKKLVPMQKQVMEAKLLQLAKNHTLYLDRTFAQKTNQMNMQCFKKFKKDEGKFIECMKQNKHTMQLIESNILGGFKFIFLHAETCLNKASKSPQNANEKCEQCIKVAKKHLNKKMLNLLDDIDEA